MSLTDSYGNSITTTDQTARDAYDRGVHLFLGANFGAVEAFNECVKADPGFALGHAALARASMMAGDMPAAQASIAEARRHEASCDTRECQHIAALSLVLSGQPAAARSVVEDLVQSHPRDVIVAQLCTNIFGLIGFSGEVARESELLAFTSALLPHYGEDWWMTSMHALSLCETGQIDASSQLMEKSLSLNPRNAQASHFKAHAQYEAGEIKEGRAFLSEWMVGYDDRSILHGHLSWHQALWALHDGDEAEMWKAIDTGIGPGGSKGLPINVLTDTAAILYRAELADVSVSLERWHTLSDYAARFFPETGQSFADMHAALCHAMAGQGDRLAYIADTAKGFAGDLVAPVARAWGEIAHQNWQSALDELAPVMHSAVRLGGSRAQRDLLELTYVNILMKLGQTDEARRSLVTRRPILCQNLPLATT
ncbi:MAG: tetratricopeptide repeat protein [Paracoccaceae bacterium]